MLFLKKGGSFRPVHNLKNLNRFILYRHFKMEGNSMLKHLVKQGDWFTKIDLKDAYLTVPINPAHQRFLQLQWRNVVYQFTCLPFGLSSAPWAFTKLLKPVVAFLRRHGIRLIIYLDDILIIGSSKVAVMQDFNFAVELLKFLGFIINVEKSVGDPTQEIEFLGLNVNSLSLSVALPREKVDSILNLCMDAMSKSRVSLREMASILGKFVWATNAVPFAQAHYRNFQLLYIAQAKTADMEKLITLSEESCSDLSWWVENLARQNGKPLVQNDPDLVIFSDASLSGWGGYCNGVRARGPWPLAHRRLSLPEMFCGPRNRFKYPPSVR